MSQTPEPPALSLADQALAGLPSHTNSQASYQGQYGYWVQAEAKFVPCSNPGTAIAFYRQRLAAGDIAVDHNHGTACVGRIKLVAEHTAFRQQVATELAVLLSLPSHGYLDGRTTDPNDDSRSSYDDESRSVAESDYQDLISAAAARLGIELPR